MKSLPAKPDRTVIYYKVTNKEERHNGLQYKTGLIVDPVEFDNNPKHTCTRGGIYFTTKESLHKFFGYGKWIRPVVIPENAKAVLDSEGDKYRADRLIFKPRKTFKFYATSLFDKKTFPKESYRYLAQHCPNHFDEWFDKKTFPKNSYRYLAQHCPNHFDEWFDKKTFPKNSYWRLGRYCPQHFNEWFDKKTFPKEYYLWLAIHCSEYFSKWFDEKFFQKGDYVYLARNCSEYFSKWFDRKTFPKEFYWYLIKYCPKQLKERGIKL